ncbi:hypothetical protein FNF27_01921 [Cafeteria roenbergensis]|uniref:Importin N-terminal domain-containing protein n=1 Tax=Cafeteria roenbergensis TaxID=33653 RepID=A0A5A8EL14_CAFRO|nr:hypothetical protein FNF27_01921 [Cafeteria roenbergensis]
MAAAPVAAGGPGAAPWAPKAEAISAIVDMLRKAVSQDPAQMSEAMGTLQTWESSPEFVNHLSFVLVKCPPELVPIRDVAGGTLTGIISRKAQNFTSESLVPAKQLLLSGIASSEESVRNFCANNVAALTRVLVRRERNERSNLAEGAPIPQAIRAWPELISTVMGGLCSDSAIVRQGCVRLASQLVEDVPSWVSEQGPDVLDGFLTRLYQAAEADPGSNIRYAVSALEKVALMSPEEAPPALLAGLDRWVNLLQAAVKGAPEPRVRSTAMQTVSQLVANHGDHMAPHMARVVELAFSAADDKSSLVSGSAVDFWIYFTGWVSDRDEPVDDGPGREAVGSLKAAHARFTVPLLPRLLPLLVAKLKLLPEDSSIVDVDDDGGGGVASAGEAKAEGAWAADGDQAFFFGTLTPRVAASDALQNIAKCIGDPVAEQLWPVVTRLLSDVRPETWESVEAGLLIIDTTMEGCFDWYKTRIASLIPVACDMATNSTRPVLRVSAFGVLHRAAPVLASLDDAAVVRVLGAIMGGCKNGNVHVQGRAVQALNNSLRELAMVDRLNAEWASSAALGLAAALPSLGVQGRTQACVFFAMLSEVLDPSELVPVTGPVLSSLLEWWSRRPEGGARESDTSVLAILEAANELVMNAPAASAAFAPVMMSRCMNLIRNTKIVFMAADHAGESPAGVFNAGMAFELVGNCLCAMPEAASREFVSKSSILEDIAFFVRSSHDTDVVESAIGTLCECGTQAPAEAVPAILGLWRDVVCYVHPDYAGAAGQAAWMLATMIKSARGALPAELLAVTSERVAKVFGGAFDRDGKGSTGMSAEQLSNVGLLGARIALAAPDAARVWVAHEPALVNWLASSVMNHDLSEKLEVVQTISAVISANPAIVRTPRIVQASSAAVASFAGIAKPSDPPEALAAIRTCCATIMSTIRSQLSEAEWSVEAASVNGKKLKQRVNTVTGTVVFPPA